MRVLRQSALDQIADGRVVEEDYKDLLNFEKSTRHNDRQKAALAYAEAITWDLPAD